MIAAQKRAVERAKALLEMWVDDPEMNLTDECSIKGYGDLTFGDIRELLDMALSEIP